MTVDELLAREEIRQLLITYNIAGDSAKKEEFSSVFTEDAELTAPGFDLKTREGIVNGLFTLADVRQPKLDKQNDQKHSTNQPRRFVRHNITTSKVVFTSPTTAKGRTYFMVVTEVGLDHSGIYTDEFRKEAGGWKLAKRDVRLEYISPTASFAKQEKK